MGKVKGEDVVLYIQETGSYRCSDPLGCGRSITFNIDQDMIETSITGNGRFRTYVPGAATVTANIEGLINILHTEQVTISGTITYVSSNEFTIDQKIDCIQVGSTIILDGDVFDNAPFPCLSVSYYGGVTHVAITGTLPIFTSFVGSLTYTKYFFTADRLYTAVQNATLLSFDFYETDDEGHYLQKTFEGYINSLSEVSSFDNIVTYNADITATGLPTIIFGNV